MTYSLCSLTDLKAVSDTLAGSEEFDDTLWRFCLLASSMIASATRRDFSRQVISETFDTRDNAFYTLDLVGSGVPLNANDGDKLNVRPQSFGLKGSPIDINETVSVWYSPSQTWDNETLIGAGYYHIEEMQGRLLLEYPTGRHQSALRVDYTSGYVASYAVANETYEAAAEDTAQVNSDMTSGTGIAGLFDTLSAAAATGPSVAADSGQVDMFYEDTQIVREVTWRTPTDATTHAGETEATFTLYGANQSDFSDAVAVVTRTVRGMVAGETHKIVNTNMTAYQNWRIVAQKVGASNTYCDEISFSLRDTTKPTLQGVPADLVNAAALGAKFLWQKNRSSGFGLDRSGGERNAASYTSKAAMPPEIIQMIAPYRKFLRGRN
jgi:hypothetical protein